MLFEKLLSRGSLLSDVRFLKEKVHSLIVAPEPLAGLYTWVLLSEKNLDTGSWHVL